jgi:hypothetical protein
MDKYTDYRRRAREAQDMADRAPTRSDRSSWLRIAKSWLILIPRSELTPAEAAFVEGKQAPDEPK